MPKGQIRTKAERLAELETERADAERRAKERLKTINEQMGQLRKKQRHDEKKLRTGEEFALGRLIWPMITEVDTNLKRRLIAAASQLPEDHDDRPRLERVLGRIPVSKVVVSEQEPDTAGERHVHAD